MKSEFDICIIGAGMAGATIAAYLAPKGIKIALIDHCFKEKKRIVGELLQPGAVLSLEQMGLSHLLEGFEAQTVKGYALLQGNEHTTIAYPDQHLGVGLHNGRFLQQIRASALQNESVTQIYGKALQLLENERSEIIGVSYRDSMSSEIKSIYAPLTITSDGFFSNFRADLSNNEKTVTSYFIGVILQNCDMPFPKHGHVFLSGPTPFICYPISNNEVRLLIDFPGDQLPRKHLLQAHLETNVTPYIPECMRNSYEQALQEGGFKVMPNHYMAAKPIVRKGAVMLGDALNMRHPLTGGGLTAVFSDIQILSSHLLAMPDFNNTDLIHEKIEAYYRDRQSANANLNILANALYAVMSNDLLKKAVFKFLQCGGANAQESISILAGLNRKHSSLIKQFCFLAFFGAFDLVREQILNLPKAIKLLWDAFFIIKPLIKNEINLFAFANSYFSKIKYFPPLSYTAKIQRP
ncbi:MAG: FAD-dependent monooxygenase [Methylococcaceae bacterium]|nr:FAD-dependent monooxygenase [Methylococcaceae bacterium]MDZ4156240.1 FAD-dependent monooxygenase [Methylococcales bacterium]MDP2393818.1 FAD-dependent monooxygenase [Methylococcaceae bacterium]MDP3019844.1 FAD-dependent monooxygenase [Methylococcaceae bacterium]MDP3389551.1 FAD-dependent monooxygenase [Methylococcaceae bacterium]